MGHRQCPICGAYLDPGELCDCKEEAASEAGTFESGNGKTSTDSVIDFGGKVND